MAYITNGVPAIYAIRNIVNNKMYIGSAHNCALRWGGHKRGLRNGVHHSKPLQRAHDKYGAYSFEYSVIEYVDDTKMLLTREQVWLNFFKPDYNVAKIAGSPTLGLKFSKETKAKMSAIRLGKKHPPRTPEQCARISEARRSRVNIISEAGRAKISATHIGNKYSLGKNLGNQNAKGTKWTPEQIAAKPSRKGIPSGRKGFKFQPGAYSARRKGGDAK